MLDFYLIIQVKLITCLYINLVYINASKLNFF